MSFNDSKTISRRTALIRGAHCVAVIGVACISASPAMAAKPKADREDFFYQDEPGEDGHTCSGCVNFTPKASGKYGADSGDCGLLIGDVFKNGYCQGWTDKNSPNARKAGS